RFVLNRRCIVVAKGDVGGRVEHTGRTACGVVCRGETAVQQVYKRPIGRQSIGQQEIAARRRTRLILTRRTISHSICVGNRRSSIRGESSRRILNPGGVLIHAAVGRRQTSR